LTTRSVQTAVISDEGARMAQSVNPVWWLGLVTGILEIALGF